MQRVSIHAPVWVRHPIAAPIGFFVKFQFTHPCGCDPPDSPETYGLHCFNSRTRVGATQTFLRPRKSPGFQFTHPCGCDALPFPPDDIFRGFNSRTRVGATDIFRGTGDGTRVSIHAPVWVRRQPETINQTTERFQFTHPCGCDHNMLCYRYSFTVSIHAPVWVRPRGCPPHKPKRLFQFTHPCGCDLLHPPLLFNPRSFNSRTRVGATFVSLHQCGALDSFNSRTRVGATA